MLKTSQRIGCKRVVLNNHISGWSSGLPQELVLGPALVSVLRLLEGTQREIPKVCKYRRSFQVVVKYHPKGEDFQKDLIKLTG